MTTVGDMLYHSGGVPVGGQFTTGNIFFVDSGTGSNSNDGTDVDHPVATVDYAVGLCTANNGDIIYVFPGHNETIVSATSLVVDVAGTTIIGLGQGRTRPMLDFDNTAGSLELDAASCRFSNMILRASVTSGVIAVNVDADEIEFDHCLFTYEATGDDFITTMDIDAVDYAYIHDNVFLTEIGGAGTATCIRMDDAHNMRIENNLFSGTWTGAVIFCAGALCNNLIMMNNVIYNSDTSSYNGIDMGTLSTTGISAYNLIMTLYDTTLAKVYRPADLMGWHNICVNAVSEKGIDLPATTGG